MVAPATKIMIVDDEPDIVNSLQHFLLLHGFEVDCAPCAEKALQMLKKKEVDIVLLDMMMPGLHGAKAASLIKERYPRIKIVVITAYPAATGYIEDTEGIKDYLEKPFKLEALLAKL